MVGNVNADKKHIFVVKDNLIAAKMAKLLFEFLGCHVDQAINGGNGSMLHALGNLVLPENPH